MNRVDKLNALSASNTTPWVEEATYRQENKEWLRRSAHIALLVLRYLRIKHLSQKELAQRMNVTPQYINKVLKGSENLSLQTISKLEEVLGVRLIEVSTSVVIETYKPSNYKTPTFKKDYTSSIMVEMNQEGKTTNQSIAA